MNEWMNGEEEEEEEEEGEQRQEEQLATQWQECFQIGEIAAYLFLVPNDAEMDKSSHG